MYFLTKQETKKKTLNFVAYSKKPEQIFWGVLVVHCTEKKLYGPFLWMRFNFLKTIVPLRGDSLVFTTKSPEIPIVYHMKAFVFIDDTLLVFLL